MDLNTPLLSIWFYFSIGRAFTVAKGAVGRRAWLQPCHTRPQRNPIRNWAGAPRSPQRKWAENDGRSPRSHLLTRNFATRKGKAFETYLIRPRYALANLGTRPVSSWPLPEAATLYGLNFLHFSLRFLSASALMKTPPTTDRAWK